MAELITGLQGSGKSYYAIHKIVEDSPKYDKILSDIDGLKAYDNVFSLSFPDFINKAIKPCYKMMVDEISEDYIMGTDEDEVDIFEAITTNNKSFEDAIKYLQSIHILPPDASPEHRVLLVVDEAQNYFGKTQKLSSFLLWFITQHRHLYIEVYLITQHENLLRTDYKLFNVVYKAMAPAKQVIPNKFIYKQYGGLPLNDDNLIGRITVNKKEEVFSKYKSGDTVKSPNFLKKYGIYFIVLLLFLIWAIYDYSSQIDEIHNEIVSSEHNSTKSVKSSSRRVNDDLYDELDEDTFLVKVTIFKSMDYFYFNDRIEYQYQLDFFKFMIDSKFLKKRVFSKTYDSFRKVVFYRASNSIFSFFPKDAFYPPKNAKKDIVKDGLAVARTMTSLSEEE